MTKPIDIIVVTYNNEDMLNRCVVSIIQTGILANLANLIIVNNGKQDIKKTFGHLKEIKVIDVAENIGWEGGLKRGLEVSDAPFVVFQNDDTQIPQSSFNFYQQMLCNFQDDTVGAVGPITTCASGLQSMFHPASPKYVKRVPYLIFFCVMLRKEALIKAGGIDDTLPGGDDFDLSIRLSDAGFKILIEPRSFIFHHGFVTGSAVHGDHTVDGGWNSTKMIERTNQALIRKHGFKKWLNCLRSMYQESLAYVGDPEGDIVRSYVNGDKHIVELGCGGKKTLPHVVGIDRVPKGKEIPNVYGMISEADIVADVQEDLPIDAGSQDIMIARHILEHTIDPIKTINGWKRVIRLGGKLIIAVPDERVTRGIPLNPEHLHGFHQQSLQSLLEICGFRQLDTKQCGNGTSFVSCFERLN